MKNLIFLLSALLVMCFTSRQGFAAPGDIINIQLGGSPYYDNGAAINNDSDQYWNHFSSTDQDTWATLLYSTGALSSASIEYNMTGTTGLDATGTSFPDGGIDTTLMRGFVSTDAYNTGTLSVQGLSAGTYTLYVYSQIDQDLTSSLDMTANGVDFTLSNNGSPTALTKGVNWISHNVEVGDDGLLNVSFAADNQINGLQIQAVPEPGSVVLLGIGGAFVLGLKRLRSKEDSSASA
jgi:hypothetical protein